MGPFRIGITSKLKNPYCQNSQLLEHSLPSLDTFSFLNQYIKIFSALFLFFRQRLTATNYHELIRSCIMFAWA